MSKHIVYLFRSVRSKVVVVVVVVGGETKNADCYLAIPSSLGVEDDDDNCLDPMPA